MTEHTFDHSLSLALCLTRGRQWLCLAQSLKNQLTVHRSFDQSASIYFSLCSVSLSAFLFHLIKLLVNFLNRTKSSKDTSASLPHTCFICQELHRSKELSLSLFPYTQFIAFDIDLLTLKPCIAFVWVHFFHHNDDDDDDVGNDKTDCTFFVSIVKSNNFHLKSPAIHFIFLFFLSKEINYFEAAFQTNEMRNNLQMSFRPWKRQRALSFSRSVFLLLICLKIHFDRCAIHRVTPLTFLINANRWSAPMHALPSH